MGYPVWLVNIDPLMTAAARFVKYLPKKGNQSRQDLLEKERQTVQRHNHLVCLPWANAGQYFTIHSVQVDAMQARRLLWLGLFEGSTWKVIRRGNDGTVTLGDAQQTLTLKSNMAACIWGRQSPSIG